MAEKKTVTTYESVMRDLKARRFYPIYLLMGEESYFIDKISDYISNNVLQSEELFFNQNILFGSDVTAAQIVDMAKGYPVMPAEHRLIVVKEAQNIRSFDALERYLDKPMSSTILVLCYKNGTIDRRKKIVAKAEAVGVVFESKKKRDSELPGFITTYMKTHNAAHLGEQGVEGLLPLVAAVVALFADGVDLVKENDRASGLARRLKQRAHAAGAHAHVHLHKVRAVDRKKRHPRLARQGAGHERLARAGRSVEHHAARHPRPEAAVRFGRTNKMQHVAQAFHGLVIGGHVRKTGAGRGRRPEGTAASGRLALRPPKAV